MKQSNYLVLLLLTLSLVGSSCTEDSGSETVSAPEAEQAPAPEPEPALKPSEVLVGSWAATPASIAALEKDEKLKAIFKEAEVTDKSAAFKLMMEVIGFSSVEWTFGADGAASSKVAEYILQAEEAAGKKVRDADGNLLKKEYNSMIHSGTWSTDSEAGNEISITVKDLGVDSQQFSFRVVDGDTLHALIANKSHPFPLFRVK